MIIPLILALACLARAEPYAAHTDHAMVDKDNSTKATGIVLWQYFFQQYVEATTVSDPAPQGYDAQAHACFFQIFVKQWNDADDRYALTAIQNCDPSLIASFTLQFTHDTQQNGQRVIDTSTQAADVTPTGVKNVVLKNAAADPDNFFGVLLNAAYDDENAALADLSYSYTIEIASAGQGAEDGNAVASGQSLEPVNRYQFYDPAKTSALHTYSGSAPSDRDNLDNGGMTDGPALTRFSGYSLLSQAFVGKGPVKLMRLQLQDVDNPNVCMRFFFKNADDEDEEIVIGEQECPTTEINVPPLNETGMQFGYGDSVQFMDAIREELGIFDIKSSFFTITRGLKLASTYQYGSMYNAGPDYDTPWTWPADTVFCGIDYHNTEGSRLWFYWRPLLCQA